MFSIADIEELKSRYEIQFIRNSGTGYTFYISSSLNGGENAIQFMFGKSKIERLSIGVSKKESYPAFVITEEKKRKVRDILELLGGEHEYSWGTVFFNEDNKGGSVSVGIRYGKTTEYKWLS